MKIGLIAGGGELPKNVAAAALQDSHDLTVIALDGFANSDDFSNSTTLGLSEFGKIVKLLKKSNSTHVCFAGIVKRPDFKTLKPDLKSIRYFPGAVKAAGHGDDALLRYLLGVFEKEGFDIIAPQELSKSLLLSEGMLGSVKLAERHKEDTQKACEVATQIGRLDIGQGAVICRGMVLAVEAQEGTDAMLARVAALPAALRGTLKNREGVLAKMPKPGQELRVDLPTIGPKTIEYVSLAGLAGIVAEAGRTFIIDRDDVIAAANQAGVFIAGLPASKP